MLTYCDAIRPGWMSGLLQLETKPEVTIKAWLREGTYSVTPSGAKGALLLTNITAREVVEAYCADINRFSTAAHESICNIRQYVELPRSTAWPLVTLYYSTFFYANCLLRLLGTAPVFLDLSDVQKLQEIADVYSVDDAALWKKGMYTVHADTANEEVRLVADKNKSGGSHVQLWNALSAAIARTQVKLQSAPLPSGDLKILDGYLSEIQSAVLGAGSNAAWLSSLRNSIQYKQSHGLWFPYKSELTVSRLADRVKVAVSGDDPLAAFDYSNRDELIAFRESCCLIISVCRGALLDVVNSSRKSALRFGLPRAESTLKPSST